MSEVRSAAVLFADIAASTEMRASLGDRSADKSLDGLLDSLGHIIRRHAGAVLKSDGDDVVAVFEHPNNHVNDAANAAIDCQQAARSLGQKLYVGMHAGVVEFREVFGRPDISGLAVNLAARLHKLVPDLPGHIFIAADTVSALSSELQDRVRPYGARLIKGVGPLEVHTLDWDEAVTVMPTRFALPVAAMVRDNTALGLVHQGRRLRLLPSTPPIQMGRDRNNDLPIADDQQHVSSRHLKILCRNGVWILQDISRNGTWVKFDSNPHTVSLLGEELKLISNGALCLGRPFADDPTGAYTVRFELLRI